VAELASRFDGVGRAGVAVPAVVTHGVTRTAANIDPTWIGCDAGGLFETGRSVCPARRA
jgi:polyphosphate glucokinase